MGIFVVKSIALVAILISVGTFLGLYFLWRGEIDLAGPVKGISGMEQNGKGTASRTAFYKRDQAFLSLLDDTINQLYADRRLDMRELSTRMGISERQLQRKFKSLVRRTPSEYLRSYRLRKSLGLLNHGIPVGEAARAVGFSSQSYFTSCFKARFACTPTEYQRQQNALVSNL